MTKREAAFALFYEGKSPSSPEVKALKLKAQTRANYYWEWKKGGGITPLSASSSESKGKVKVRSELEMVVPPEEAEEEEKEANGEGEESETPEPEGKKKAKPTDGKKAIPTIVAGQGLWFNIQLSTKTIQLYQIAASMQEEELTIGDFIDTCVEDFYRGRGYDLGLVKITGGQNE